MTNISLKLAIILTCCSINSAWAQRESIYFTIAEYIHVKSVLKINTDLYNIYKNKNNFSEEELKRKDEILSCAKIVFDEEFKHFLKNSTYEPSAKTITYFDENEKNLNTNIRCEDHRQDIDHYMIEELVPLILK